VLLTSAEGLQQCAICWLAAHEDSGFRVYGRPTCSAGQLAALQPEHLPELRVGRQPRELGHRHYCIWRPSADHSATTVGLWTLRLLLRVLLRLLLLLLLLLLLWALLL
jgi:hypothetical protein